MSSMSELLQRKKIPEELRTMAISHLQLANGMTLVFKPTRRTIKA
jgi:hypothetical protein